MTQESIDKNIVEYFIELYPGKELENKILKEKINLINKLGDEIVDNPNQSMFLRDSPHFTMQVARTNDLEGLIDKYTKVAESFEAIEYNIVDVAEISKGGLIEIHSVVDAADYVKFKELHEAIIEASREYLTKECPKMFPKENFDGYALENLEYCHYPAARDNYKPHASIGRFNEKLVKDIKEFTKNFNPIGNYKADTLILWQYIPNDPTFQVRNPIYIKLGESQNANNNP